MRRRLTRLLLAGALALGGVTLLACTVPRAMATAATLVSPGVVYFFETDEPVVALTIDDGPDPEETPAILDALARNQAHATFFLVGSRVAGNEQLLDRVKAESHEVANHTQYERASVLVSPDELATELDTTHALLVPYGKVRWFRPGSAVFTSDMLKAADARGYRTALGDVFPFDPLIPSSRFHAWYILRNVQSGSIIVLHDGAGRGERAAATLDLVIPELRQRGFRVVTLSELEALSDRSAEVD